MSEDEPGENPNPGRLLGDLIELIGQFGWAVRHVHAVTEEQVDFSYTVGLTTMQHPEVIVMGMPQEHAHTFLNDIGDDVRNGKRYQDGMTTDELTEPGAPVVFIRADQVDRLTAVEELYGRVDALQMVWCDSLGHLPWQEGYRNGPDVQPLLGRTEHVRQVPRHVTCGTEAGRRRPPPPDSLRPVTSPASTVYGARLRVRGKLPEILLVPLAFIRNAVIGALGLGGDAVAPAQVEVFRWSDGALVGGIPAGSGHYEQAERLDAVQRALGTLSAPAFLEAWGLSD